MAPENYKARGDHSTPENYVTELLKKAGGKNLVVGFNGSNLEQPGRTRELLEKVLSTIDNQGGFTIIVDLARVKMELPTGTYGKTTPHYQPERRDDDVEDLRTLLRECDGLIIATPVYWFSHSSLIQRLVEHLTPLEDHGELEGKVAGIIATEDEEGAGIVIAQMMLTLTHLGMVIAPYSGIFSRGPGRDLRWVQEDVGNLGVRVMRLIKATKGINWDAPNGKGSQ